MALNTFRADLYPREIYLAYYLIDQKNRPQAKQSGLKRLFGQNDDERYRDYYKIFNKSGFDLYKVRKMHMDNTYVFATLYPMFDFMKRHGMKGLEVNDYNGTLKDWYEAYQEFDHSASYYEDYLRTFLEEAKKIPAYLEGYDQDIKYLERPLSEANALEMSYADFKDTVNFDELIEEINASEAYDVSFEEWENNQYAHKIGPVFQKRVIKRATNPLYATRDVIRYFDDILGRMTLLDRQAYKAFIREHGTTDEKNEVKEVVALEKTLVSREREWELFFLDKATIYYQELTPVTVSVPFEYTGQFLLLFLRDNPQSEEPVARSYTYVDGRPIKEGRYNADQLKRLYDITPIDIPVIIVENGTAQKRYRYVAEVDHAPFDEQMEQYWDARYIVENAEDLLSEGDEA